MIKDKGKEDISHMEQEEIKDVPKNEIENNHKNIKPTD